ncbi:hypothetical protein BH18ACT17_BH18ACT17_08830 [soil metagenome]
MCGITGIFYKQRDDGPIGQAMVAMCDRLFRRGPDPAGVALYGPPVDGLVVRVDLDRGDLDAAEREVLDAAEPDVLLDHTGIPTLSGLCEAMRALDDMKAIGEVQVIVSGGIKNGVDAAKATRSRPTPPPTGSSTSCSR